MLFSNSPVKNIVEKINPSSQKNKISRLKFERKGDYRTFLKFIKDNTREIGDIELSGKKKKAGLLIGGGILGLGLLAFGGRGKDDDSQDGKLQLNSIKGVLEKAKSENRKKINKRPTTQVNQTKGSIARENVRRKSIKNRRILDQIKKKEDKKRKIEKKMQDDVKKQNNRNKNLRKINKRLVNLNTEVNEQNKITKVKPKSSAEALSVGGGDSKTSSGRATVTVNEDFNKDIKDLTKPKKGEVIKQQRILRNFNQSRITEPTRISDKNFKNLSGLFSGDFGSDDLDNIIKEQRGFDKEGRRIVPRQVDKTDTLQAEIDMRKLKQAQQQEIFNRQYGTDGGYGDSNVGDMTQNKSSQRKTRATIDRSKFFKAPEVPKRTTAQLNNFQKVNKFSNRILNSPAAKFTTFLGGMFSSPKFMILKALMEPTPLADGTLEGKPGVGIYNSEKYMLDEETALNIFMPSEGDESVVPFNTGANLPSVTTPTDLQSPKSNVFIDYEFNNTEDLFFIKMAGS